VLLGDIDPSILAGLLYCGPGSALPCSGARDSDGCWVDPKLRKFH
jgi:hypothetical protein